MRRGGLSLLAGLGLALGCSPAACRPSRRQPGPISSRPADSRSQNPTVVRRGNPKVRVIHVALVESGRQLAVAVTMRNLAARPVNDLPISVGLRRGGRALYLNRSAESWLLRHARRRDPGGGGDDLGLHRLLTASSGVDPRRP